MSDESNNQFVVGQNDSKIHEIIKTLVNKTWDTDENNYMNNLVNIYLSFLWLYDKTM